MSAKLPKTRGVLVLVRVTAEIIRRARVENVKRPQGRCPIERALDGMKGWKGWTVGYSEMVRHPRLRRRAVVIKLPAAARRFAMSFDDGKPVKPVKFRVQVPV